LTLAREAESQNADHALHFGLLEHEAFDLLHHGTRAIQRRARRQLHVYQQVALVFRRQKGRWQACVDKRHHADDGSINKQVAPGTLEQARDQTFIALGGARKSAVEPAKKTGLPMMMTGLNRFEQRGAQRRRERQRQEGRKSNRGHHDRRKLAVNIADRTSEECQWNEH